MPEAFVLLLLPVSLALIPLLILPGALFYFDITPKIAVLLIAVGVALFQFRANMAGLGALRSCRLGRWLIYLLGAQATVILMATVFSHDLALSIVGGSWRRNGAITELALCVFVLLIAARFASEPRAIEVTLKSIAASCLLVSMYGIAQFFGVDPFLPTAPYHAGEGIWTIVRPPSTLGNANFLANYLIYAVFASVVLVGQEHGLWRVVSAAAFGFGMIAIVLSGTRSGILGLLVALGFLVAGLSGRPRVWILGSGVCAAALIAILATTPLGLPLKARVRWSREDALGGGRLLLWRDSLRMFAHRPLTGFGPDHFSQEFPAFQSVELARLHPDFYQESPHNALLDAAVDGGVGGAVVWIGIVALGFYAAWCVRRQHPRLALCLASGFAGGSVCAQFSPPVLCTELYALSLIGMLCGVSCRGASAPLPSRVRMGFATVGCGFLLFAGALVGSDILAGSFKRAVGAGDVDTAVARYRTVRDHAVLGVDLYASRSLARLSFKNASAWPVALEAGRRATQTAEDRQNAFLNLAQLYALQNDAPRAEESIRAAMSAAPNWFKPHWILAELLIRTGRVDEARGQARIAWDLDAGKDAEVVRTWRALGSPR